MTNLEKYAFNRRVRATAAVNVVESLKRDYDYAKGQRFDYLNSATENGEDSWQYEEYRRYEEQLTLIHQLLKAALCVMELAEYANAVLQDIDDEATDKF